MPLQITIQATLEQLAGLDRATLPKQVTDASIVFIDVTYPLERMVDGIEAGTIIHKQFAISHGSILTLDLKE